MDASTDVVTDTAHRLEVALLSLNRLTAARLLSASAAGNSPLITIERLLVPVMERIGSAWEKGELALSQVYMSGRLCEELVNSLLPDGDCSRKEQPRLALAVLEDSHLLGKRMVYAALRVGGYSFLDYGRMNAESLVRKVADDGVEVLLISTLMLSSALRVAAVREGLDRLGIPVRIVVGGAPFRLDEQLWREVGADAMGRNASDVFDILECFSGGAV